MDDILELRDLRADENIFVCFNSHHRRHDKAEIKREIRRNGLSASSVVVETLEVCNAVPGVGRTGTQKIGEQILREIVLYRNRKRKGGRVADNAKFESSSSVNEVNGFFAIIHCPASVSLKC